MSDEEYHCRQPYCDRAFPTLQARNAHEHFHKVLHHMDLNNRIKDIDARMEYLRRERNLASLYLDSIDGEIGVLQVSRERLRQVMQ